MNFEEVRHRAGLREQAGNLIFGLTAFGLTLTAHRKHGL
jgi:hypothetical protein